MVTNCPVFYSDEGAPAEVVEVSPGLGPEVVRVSSSSEVVEVPPPHKRWKRGWQYPAQE